MKVKYLIFGIAMTAFTLVAAFVIGKLWGMVLHTLWSFEDFTFSLVVGIVTVFYYNMAAESDKED